MYPETDTNIYNWSWHWQKLNFGINCTLMKPEIPVRYIILYISAWNYKMNKACLLASIVMLCRKMKLNDVYCHYLWVIDLDNKFSNVKEIHIPLAKT